MKGQVITINTNFPNKNPLKRFTNKIHSKAENFLFSIIQKLPEKFIPSALMNWMEQYLNKRISELNHQIVQDRWHTAELEKTVSKISSQQQDKK